MFSNAVSIVNGAIKHSISIKHKTLSIIQIVTVLFYPILPDLLKLLGVKQSSANKAVLQLCKLIIFCLLKIHGGLVFAGTEDNAWAFCLGTALNIMNILSVKPINDVSINIHAKIHTACF